MRRAPSAGYIQRNKMRCIAKYGCLLKHLRHDRSYIKHKGCARERVSARLPESVGRLCTCHDIQYDTVKQKPLDHLIKTYVTFNFEAKPF